MRILTRSTALLATCALLLLGGCASDGGGAVDAADTTASGGDGTTTTEEGGGAEDAEAFCDFVLDQEDLDIDEEPEAVAAAMEEMRGLAPEELSDEIEVLLGMVEKMADIDEEDPEAFGALMAIAMDPEVEEAVSAIDEFGVEECGLAEGELMGTDDSGPPTTTEDGMIEDPLAEDELGIVLLQRYIEEGYGDEPWADSLSSWSIMGGTDVQVGPSVEDLTLEDAKAACEALAEQVFALEPEASLEIMDAANEVVVRWIPSSASCAPVL